MNQPTDPKLTLSPEDAAVVDALLQNGRNGGTTANAAQSDRAQRTQAWLKMLDASPMPEAPGDLLERTLARVQSERMKFQPAQPLAAAKAETPVVRSRGFRYLSDLAAMAIAASLLGIVISLGVFQARQSSNRVACATNLQHVTMAFSTYSANNRGELPALASVDANWLTPNPTIAGSHSNADNMMPLMNASLIHPANLICAGRDISSANPATSRTEMMPIADSARGYSYVNMFAVDHPGWDGKHATIILADRNPLFDPQAAADPQSNSINHAGHGNYVLRADGTVTWETSPNVGPGRDNIWTIGAGPQYQTRFAGTETPASEKDVFLAP